jgi:hypothetical protein
MVQPKTVGPEIRVTDPAKSVLDWVKIEQIARELESETDESKLGILTQRLLEALGEASDPTL